MTPQTIEKIGQNLPTTPSKYYETAVSLLGKKINVSVPNYLIHNEVRKSLFADNLGLEKIAAARIELEGNFIVGKVKLGELEEIIFVALSKTAFFLGQLKIDENTQILMAQSAALEIYEDFKFLYLKDIELAIKLGSKGKLRASGEVLYLSPQTIYAWVERYNETIKMPVMKLLITAKEKITHQKAHEVLRGDTATSNNLFESILKIAKHFEDTGEYINPNLSMPAIAASWEAQNYDLLEKYKIAQVSANDKWYFLHKNLKQLEEELKNNPLQRTQKEAKQFLSAVSLFFENPKKTELLDFNNQLFVLARTRSKADCFKLIIKYSKEINLIEKIENQLK